MLVESICKTFADAQNPTLKDFNIDSYANFGGTLQIDNWRTLTPKIFYQLVEQQIQWRIG